MRCVLRPHTPAGQHPVVFAVSLMQTHKVVKELGRHSDLRTAGECKWLV